MIALLQNITFVRGRVAEGWVQPEIHLFGVQLRASYVMLSLLTSWLGTSAFQFIYFSHCYTYSYTFTSINYFYEKVQGKLSTHVKYILNTKQIADCIELNIIILGTNNVLQSLIFHARS